VLARRVAALLPPLLIVALLAAGFARYQADQTRAAEWYAQAEDAEAAGRYTAAADLFAAAGDYRDAEARRAAALATYRSIYLDAAAALDAGRYDEAIELLLPLARRFPGESDATLLLAQARAAREQALRDAADAAARAGDWLTAETVLAELAATTGDPAVAAEVDAVRRDHAPLVLARSDGLYLVGPDGDGERLVTNAVPATQPSWSPDRGRIAFASPDASERESADLWIVNVDGTGLRKVAERVASYRWAIWSPDGNRLAYSSFATFDTYLNRGTIGVRMVDLTTGVETDLTGGRWPYATSPTWSPDGSRLAFVTRAVTSLPDQPLQLGDGGIQVIDLATGAGRSLTGARLPDAWRVVWNPRSDLMLVSTRPWEEGYGQPEDLFLLDAVTGALTPLDTGPAHVSGAVWSPDGERYAFVEIDRAILRVGKPNRPGGWIRLDYPTSDILTWAPDGRALLAVSRDAWTPSLVIRFDGPVTTQTSIEIDFTADYYASAPPQWSSRNPTPPAVAPTTGGTAHDPSVRAAPAPVPDLTSHRRPTAPT
jgi:Tol biopolymer transport system component